MERHGKHVIVEKPTFMRPSQLTAAYATQRRGLHVFPVCPNRHNKAVRRIKQALSTTARSARCARVLVPAATLLRHGAVARHVFPRRRLPANCGHPPRRSVAPSGRRDARVSASLRTLGADTRTPPSRLEYASGAVGTVEVTTAARPDDFEASLFIVGAKGLPRSAASPSTNCRSPRSVGVRDQQRGLRRRQGARRGLRLRYYAQMYKDIVAFFRDGAPIPSAATMRWARCC